MINFNDLETRGFVKIPGFLKANEIQDFQQDFDQQPFTANKNYPRKKCGAQSLVEVYKRIQVLLEQIRSSTGMRTDLRISPGEYIDNSIRFYNLHQDHESFFMFQDVSNFLNFYITVIKPDPDRSGLKLIPFDRLDVAAPEFSRSIKGKGAASYRQSDEKTQVSNDETGQTHELDFNIDSISECPRLESGDLLILRGDLIHGTQDADTRRLAVTIRCMNSQQILHKERFMSGCQKKKTYIENNKQMYQRLFSIFENQETVTVADLFVVRS
jgi:hypothetical protein